MSRRTGHTNLVTLGSAAVLAVYTAGYVRTKPAADRMEAASAASGRRRAPVPDASISSSAPPSAVDRQVPASAAGDSSQDMTVANAAPANVVSSKNTATQDVSTEKPKETSKEIPPVGKSALPSQAQADVSKATLVDTSAQAVTSSISATATPPQSTTPVVPPPIVTAAPPTTDSAAASPPAAKPLWKDGVYTGRGRSRHGDIEATVEIQNHRIVSAVISQCLTRYSCSWINPLLPQVISRQSADVDVVSGATESANALYYAVLQALSFAK